MRMQPENSRPIKSRSPLHEPVTRTRSAGNADPPHPAELRGTDRRAQTSRRSDAQRDSSYRFDSCVLRSTLDTCVSTVFTEMNSSPAISL